MNELRKAWLKELGVDRVFAFPAAAPAHPVPQAASAAPASAPVADAARQAPPAQVAAVQEAPVLNPREAFLALHASVQSCMACELSATRRNVVFGEGVTDPEWLIIGEAPGEQEDRAGRPFVGKSGQLLDVMLSVIGANRQTNAYIANIVKCRPPNNRDPLPAEIQACQGHLHAQIALLKPRRILLVGRMAAQTLLNSDARISSLRQQVYQLEIGSATYPAVATYHPAYLLRSPGEKKKAWQDLLLARDC